MEYGQIECAHEKAHQRNTKRYVQILDAKRVDFVGQTHKSYSTDKTRDQRKCDRYDWHLSTTNQIFIFGILLFLNKSEIDTDDDANRQHHYENRIVRPRKSFQLRSQNIAYVGHFAQIHQFLI